MGAPVGTRRRWAATLAGGFLLLAGCREKPECQPSTRTSPLPAPYDQFFGRLPVCAATPSSKVVAANSSTGLTDSFIGSCVDGINPYTFDESASSPCETVRYERRSVYAYASLYRFYFITAVEQRAEGPVLLLRDQTPNTGAPVSDLTFAFATGVAEVRYRDATTNTSVPFDQAPVVTALSNFQSGGRTYPQVWRISHPLNAAQGRATAIAVFFIDRDYGLIRFDQRDGTSWTLTH